MNRQWLTPEEKGEVKKIVSKLFSEGLTDRAIADTISGRGFRGVWSGIRICQMRKLMGLKKGEALPPELRGQATPARIAELKDRDPDGIEDPAKDPPMPRVQDVEYTFADLILKMEDVVRFAKKVQEEFRKKGGSVFF